MKLKKFHYLHFSAIALLLFAGYLVIAFLPAATRFSSSTSSLFINAFSVALLLQGACISYLAPKQKKTDFWIAIDIAIISVLLLAIIAITTLSGKVYHQPLTGLFCAVSFILRSIFLVALLSSASKHLSENTIYGVMAIVLISLMIPTTSWRIINRPLQGDEPFYLLITYSLIYDQDINLENNYLDGDSLAFSQTRLSPQLFDNFKGDKLISRHPPFLPLLLIPSFLAGKAIGALYFMMLFAIVLAYGLSRTMAHIEIPAPLRVCISCLVVLSAPIVFYTQAIFTELPAAALGAIILSLCIDPNKIRPKTLFLIVILFFAGLLLKTRLVFLYLPPIVFSLLVRCRLKKNTWIWIGGLMVVLLIIGFFNLVLFGSMMGRYSFQDLTKLSTIRAFRGMIGLFWDQQYGLFPMNFLYLLSFPGIYYLYRKYNRSHFLIWASAIAPYFMLIALYAELSGGHCPKGRFLIAWTPLLALPLAAFIQSLNRNRAILLITAFSTLSLPITTLLLAFPDWQIVNPGETDQLLTIFSQSFHVDILNIIPSFDRIEEGFAQNMLLFPIFTMVFSIFIIVTNRRKPFISCRNPIVLGLCLSLLILTTGFLCLKRVQLSLMHVEDATFEHMGNSTLFWEEPYYWDQLQPPPVSPYISGIRLFPGGSILRKLPLRKPLSTPEKSIALEIVARANYPKHTIPSLEIFIGRDFYKRIPIRSTDFQNYFVPWLFGLPPNTPQVLFKYSENNHSETFIDIDKIQLVGLDTLQPPIHPEEQNPFPVYFKDLVLNSIRLPDNLLYQGQSFEIHPDFSTDRALDDFHIELLFLADTRSYSLTIDVSGFQENRVIQTAIPAEAGAGVFNVLMLVSEKNEPDDYFFPEGESAFLSGNRAWVGNIEILAVPVEMDEKWNSIALDTLSVDHASVTFMPKVCHLAKNSQVELALEKPVLSKELIIISHLSHIFEQMPWETHIGNIVINPGPSEEVLPIILGRHTAEAMYEFGGKAVRLPHREAPVAARLPETLLWPREFKGMVYNAVYYKYKFTLNTPVNVNSLAISTGEIPGVWNIFSIGLISDT